MAKIIEFPRRDAVAGLEKATQSKLRAWKMGPEKTGRELTNLEEELDELFLQAKRAVLKDALQSAFDEEAEAVVVDGRTCRRVLVSKKTYITSAGAVEVQRSLFKDRCRKEPAFAAMDLQLGIIGDLWTPKAAEQALWMVTQMVPAKAAEALRRVGGMTPSKSSLDRLAKIVSTRWELDRATHESELIASQEIPEGTTLLAVSLDGVYAPIEDEAEDHVEKREAKQAQGLATRGPDAFREIGCASIAFYDASCELLGALRFGRAPEPKKMGVKMMLAAELRGLLLRHPKLKVVFLSDGARDHWDFFDSLDIRAEQALDYYHAAEHLNYALGAAYGDGSIKAQRRFAELRHILLEERHGAQSVLRSLTRLGSLRTLSSHGQKILKNAARYFRRNAHRMEYARLRARKFPIGSGVMEASCKTLVAQRLKLSGQRWSVDGAQAILTPRGWDQSDRFDEAFAILAATYEREITVFTPMRGRLATSR